MRGKERERTDEDEVLHLRLQSPHHIRCIGLKSPIPITLQTTSWLLGITYPQSINYFLTGMHSYA
jgi:hypothetical protein